MAASQQAVWNMNDLLFISATGEAGSRGISFAHFRENEGGQPRLETFSWDERETHLFYLRNLNLERLRWPDDEYDAEGWRERWASAFTTEHREVVRTSQQLSSELAKLARRTRELIREVYGYETRDGSLHRLHESLRTVLIEDLTLDSFADMVAQTISYGLFSARATGEAVLGLAHLEAMVPNTNPFLKELFAEFASMRGHEKHQIDFDELGVSELVELLNTANIEAVLQDFGRQSGGGTQDPVIYFYEEFLREYDNEQRVRRGEFYTPKPVVSYIVRSVDRVLRDELDCPDGLADTSTMEWNGQTWPKVMILDPATGTGTFLETVIDVIHETMTAKWKKEGKKQEEIHAAWNEYVLRHLLPRLHGFELMMAPYSVAHMKLGLKLRETGYDFGSEERLRVFLTNALEEPKDFSGQLYAEFLAREAVAANNVKREVPVNVVLGNPPYANFGRMNRSSWILHLLQDYKRNLGEKKLNLDDDFIKFMRLGQYCIGRSNQGILAYITNNTYIDGITHRRMRDSLIATYSDAYILNLHGSIRKKEQTPEGGKDENVFDIQQGVAIGMFVKESETGGTAKVHYADLWGLSEHKYDWLAAKSIKTTAWSRLDPEAEQFYFVPRDLEMATEYETFTKISTAFSQYNTGIQTKRDRFVYHLTRQELESTLDDIRSLTTTQLTEKYQLPPDGRDGQVSSAKTDVLSDAGVVTQVAYHPFDSRWSLYTRKTKGLMAYPRHPLMSNGLQENLLLLAVRNARRGNTDSFFVANTIADKDAVSPFDNATVFPLYLYPQSDNLLDVAEEGRRPNLTLQFTDNLSEALGLRFVSEGKGNLADTFGPEDVFHYAYAVFHSPTYRERYAEFLKRDFPRLPLTSDRALFSDLSQWGEELVSLHLMRSSSLNNLLITFSKSGSTLMEKAKYVSEENRVYINKEQYFDNVAEETWNFRVGGYQVLDKWLKDRKGRTLTSEDIEHYRKVVKALHETSQIMETIDEVIEEHGGWPLPGSVNEGETDT